jgi:hypothetical protein
MGVDRPGLPPKLEFSPIDLGEVRIVAASETGPPPLGFLLSLLAFGLALAPARAVKAFTLVMNGFSDRQSAVMFFGTLAISIWSLVNLYLLLKRRRAFPTSMTVMLGVGVAFGVLAAAAGLLFAPDSVGSSDVFSVVAGTVTAALWIAYLLRSKHVRAVFVK